MYRMIISGFHNEPCVQEGQTYVNVYYCQFIIIYYTLFMILFIMPCVSKLDTN